MNKIWFTADTHFGHKNIIKYEDRPFANVSEMDKAMINNWNNKVSKNDTVYIIGDFTMDSNGEYTINILNQLNGNIHLITGNHDYCVSKKHIKDRFNTVSLYKEIKVNGYSVCMMHYPIAVWNKKHHGSVHLYGHIHSNKDNHHPLVGDLGRALNVGVDVNNYCPISWEEVCAKLNIPEKNIESRR